MSGPEFTYDPASTPTPTPATTIFFAPPEHSAKSTLFLQTTYFVVPEPAPTSSSVSVLPEPAPTTASSITTSFSTATVEPTAAATATSTAAAAPKINGFWYQNVSGPITYILLVYCFASLFALFALLHTGVLGLDLNINVRGFKLDFQTHSLT